MVHEGILVVFKIVVLGRESKFNESILGAARIPNGPHGNILADLKSSFWDGYQNPAELAWDPGSKRPHGSVLVFKVCRDPAI